MVEYTKISGDDVKGKSLPYFLARASHEMEAGTRTHSVSMVRFLGEHLKTVFYDEQGLNREVQPEVEAVWKTAFDKTFSGDEPAAQRALMLTAMKNDLVALAEYNAKEADPARVDEMLRFMANLNDGLTRPKRGADVARSDSRAA